MKIHYFQRYHAKENVATANTMLLLSRLYSYSPDKFFKFFRFLNSEYCSTSFNPEIVFTLQEKSIDSIPDAAITQESFKIVVETKMSDWFYEDQLLRHLNSFNNETYEIMITLAPELMAKDKKESFEEKIKEFNQKQKHQVIHVNTTFETIANAVGEVLDERDYEIQAILNDYWEYCYNDGLISVSEAWKYMRMQLAGVTFDFNIESNIYYDNAERSFREHNILGLYKNKSVRAIGKIIGRFTAIKTNTGVEYECELGELTDERKEAILKTMEEAELLYGYNLKTIKHRYFFVEKFYETDFKKITPKAPMGTRIFDLTQVLDTNDVSDIKELAQKLKEQTWT
ncbi:hypothetical protein [Fusobacterium polymorphum]|uniref:hypothetical protein n=1 Tax=Fusobacterium nucleatum subsp. polymorphum TaxID=76857 RepID=UPI00300BD6AD